MTLIQLPVEVMGGGGEVGVASGHRKSGKGRKLCVITNTVLDSFC